VLFSTDSIVFVDLSALAEPLDHLRHVHLGMLDAVLDGGGVPSVARLAA
jgi:hypothetical protein